MAGKKPEGIRLQVYLDNALEAAVNERLVRAGEKTSDRIRSLVLLALDTGAADPVAYIDDLILQASDAWRRAYDLLIRLGWTPRAIQVACAELDGYWTMHSEPMPNAIAISLYEAEHLDTHTGPRAGASRLGVPVKTWDELVGGLVIPEGADQARVVRSRAQAEALVTLSREWWRRNGELERLLGAKAEGARVAPATEPDR